MSNSWRKKQENNNKFDHIIIFPAYELIYNDIIFNNATSCIFFFFYFSA
jgi:hypothetical protein